MNFKEQMKIRDEKMNTIMDDLDDGMAMDTIINMYEYLLRDVNDNYYDGTAGEFVPVVQILG